MRGLSLVVASAGFSLLPCAGFSLRSLLFLQNTGSRCAGFSSCGSWALELRLSSCGAPQHVGSSWTRDQTRVPCVGRWILFLKIFFFDVDHFFFFFNEDLESDAYV